MVKIVKKAKAIKKDAMVIKNEPIAKAPVKKANIKSVKTRPPKLSKPVAPKKSAVKTAKAKTALIKENKIHTGFRLSKDNFDLLGKYEKDLGISRTGVVDMILTVVRNDEKLLLDLIGKAIKHK